MQCRSIWYFLVTIAIKQVHTCCGHKANKPSHSARWPLRQMKSDKSQMVTGLISGDCSSQDHDKALTSYSSETWFARAWNTP